MPADCSAPPPARTAPEDDSPRNARAETKDGGRLRRATAALGRAVALPAALAAGLLPAFPAAAQQSVRARIEAMKFPALDFEPPAVRAESVSGVPVFYLQDRDLPLVTIYATFKGGVRRLPRSCMGAVSALPALLRSGGAAAMSPEEVDERIEALALSMSFGQGGGGGSSRVNTLAEHVDAAVALWGSMLRAPRFDSAEVETWRGAELERVRRQADDPTSLAFRRFNAIMYGDHPVGWTMDASDLEPDDLSLERLRFVHQAVVCPQNMAFGVVGDIGWQHAERLLRDLLDDWPACSGGLLAQAPEADIRDEPGVFVLHKETEQSVIVAAHSTSLRRRASPDYFASRVANAILGASGLSSRLSQAVRTREGLSYSASSLWTTPVRSDGLVGALTRTKPETTLAAARLLLATIDSMRAAAPAESEIARVAGETANGFAFNFRSSSQVVARSLAYRNQGLPDDWLQVYAEGIARVTPAAVHRVFREHVDPARMTILLVGDTTRFDGSPSALGPVAILPQLPRGDGARPAVRSRPSPQEAGAPVTSRPRELRRSRPSGAPIARREAPPAASAPPVRPAPESPSPTRASRSRPSRDRTPSARRGAARG